MNGRELLHRTIEQCLTRSMCGDAMRLVQSFLPCRSLKQCVSHIGKRVDAQDTLGLWYTSTVIQIDGAKVLIHFDDWQTRWREWIQLDEYGRSPHLAPICTFANGGHCFQQTASYLYNTQRYQELHEGKVCECCCDIARADVKQTILDAMLTEHCYCEPGNVNIMRNQIQQLCGQSEPVLTIETALTEELVQTTVLTSTPTSKLKQRYIKLKIQPRRGWSEKRIRKYQARLNRKY